MCLIIDEAIKEQYQGITKGYKIYQERIGVKFRGEFHNSLYKIGKEYKAKELSEKEIICMSSHNTNPYGFHILLTPIIFIGYTHIQIEVEFSDPVAYGTDELYQKPAVIARNIKLIKGVK